MHAPREYDEPAFVHNYHPRAGFRDSTGDGTRTANRRGARTRPTEDSVMDLASWLPGMVLLGLSTLGLMFLFVEACDKV